MVLHYGICIRTRDLKMRMFYIVFHGNKSLSVIFIDVSTYLTVTTVIMHVRWLWDDVYIAKSS